MGLLQRLGQWVQKVTRSPQTPMVMGGGWRPLVRESFTGAWQQNVTVTAESGLSYAPVFACVTLIASDIAKLGLRLVAIDAAGIWSETESPAFSPVLRKPNRYQTRISFIEQWMSSKLIHGNTYVLKERDQRGIVVALYVLDPTRVLPLVTTSGDVYYQLKRDDLATLESDIVVPAREIIHDKMVALYHPLIGVSPIYACGMAALQGLAIQSNSKSFFANGSTPGGVVLVPGEIKDEQLEALNTEWTTKFSGNNAGKVAFLSHGMKYEPTAMNAVDAQLIDQLKWTAEAICSAYHIQPYMISVGPPPPYANIEPLNLQYYAQCLQEKIEKLELCLDEGLELPKPYGTEFNLDDLLRMDSATRTTNAKTAIAAGMTINESRRKHFDLGPVEGGDTVYLQQQMWPIEELTGRPIPGQPALPPLPAEDADTLEAASLAARVLQKAIDEGLLHAA